MQHAHDIGLIPDIQSTIDHNIVIKAYLNNLETSKVCKELGITQTVLYGILKKHGIKRRTNCENQDKYKYIIY